MAQELVSTEYRLQKVLVQDRQDNPMRIYNVLKSDILYVLKNYMEITAENLDLNITVNELGFFDIRFNCKVRRLKTLSAFLE